MRRGGPCQREDSRKTGCRPSRSQGQKDARVSEEEVEWNYVYLRNEVTSELEGGGNLGRDERI